MFALSPIRLWKVRIWQRESSMDQSLDEILASLEKESGSK